MCCAGMAHCYVQHTHKGNHKKRGGDGIGWLLLLVVVVIIPEPSTLQELKHFHKTNFDKLGSM
jgi:hypothetical protein